MTRWPTLARTRPIPVHNVKQRSEATSRWKSSLIEINNIFKNKMQTMAPFLNAIGSCGDGPKYADGIEFSTVSSSLKRGLRFVFLVAIVFENNL
jgi:hypothetical protein